MSVTLESSDNVSRSTCSERQNMAVQSYGLQFQYIEETERIITEAMVVKTKNTTANVTAERIIIIVNFYCACPQ